MPTIHAGDLYRIITAVAPHADTDTTFAIRSVHLEVDRTHITAVATDRRTMAVARHPLITPAGTAITQTIDLDAATGLAGRLLCTPAAVVDLSGLHTDPSVTIDSHHRHELYCPVPEVESRFPDWRAKLRTITDIPAEPVSALGMDPALLARLTAVPTTEAAELHMTGSANPVLARIGDWYLAAIMPRRPDSTDRDRADRVISLARDLAGASGGLEAAV